MQELMQNIAMWMMEKQYVRPPMVAFWYLGWVFSL